MGHAQRQKSLDHVGGGWLALRSPRHQHWPERSVQAGIFGDQSQQQDSGHRRHRRPRWQAVQTFRVRRDTHVSRREVRQVLARRHGAALHRDSMADVSNGRRRADVRSSELFFPLGRKSSLRHRTFPQGSQAALQRAQSSSSAQREYLAGEYSIADIATYPWVWRHDGHHVALEDYPNVKRWYDQIGKRPAVQRGMEIPKK